MLEAYRVTKEFFWNGYFYAPKASCGCGCENCTQHFGTSCKCNCHCKCSVDKTMMAGDIWLVDAGNPRKLAMLGNPADHDLTHPVTTRFVRGDATIPAIDILLKEDKYKRLVEIPITAPAPIKRSRSVRA